MRRGLAITVSLLATTIASAQESHVATPTVKPGLASYIDRQIRDLADPARADIAATALQNIGAPCVPALRHLLAPRTRSREPKERVLGALYVLGTIQPPPAEAIDDVRDLLDLEQDELLRQATWCAGRLAFSADAGARNRVHEVLQRRWRAMPDPFLADVVRVEILIAEQLGVPFAIAALDGNEYHGNRTVAVCEWLLTQSPDALPQRTDVATSVRGCLERLLAPAPQPWRRHQDRSIAGYVAEAWLHTSGQGLDLETSRALLGHWNQFQRLRGVAWLDEHGAVAPLDARRDLAEQLWERDDRVQQAACAAFAHWGARGLIALPSLRALANSHVDVAVRERCATAANEILAAATTATPEATALLAALDAMLRGEAPPATTPPKSPKDEAIWHDVLATLAWSDAATGKRVLDFAERCGVHDDTSLQMVLGYVASEHLGQGAFSWLARTGRMPAAGDDSGDAAESLRHVICQHAAQPVRGSGVEALAWLVAGHGATEPDLTTALADANLRIRSRAAAELVRRGASIDAEQQRLLRRLLATSRYQSLTISTADGWEVTVDGLIADESRLFATLALAQAAAIADAEPGEDLARAACGCTLAELPKWLADARRSGRLAAFLDDREAAQRARMELPPDLAWPRCAR